MATQPKKPSGTSINNIQSNLVNTDTENAIESVRIKPVEFREIARAFNPRGQSKLSVIMRCPFKASLTV